MPNTLLRTALILVALAVLTFGRALADSVWTIDESACLRINCYPVSGGTSDRSISVTGSSCTVGIAWGDGYLWVLGPRGCRSILKIDAPTGNVLAEITVNSSVCALSVAYGDGYLWVLLDNSRVARVDASTGEILGYVTPDFTPFPPRAAAYGDGCLWVLEGSSCLRISKVDPATSDILQTLNLAGTSCINAIAYGEGSLWAAGLMGAAKVSRIDPASGSVISTASYGIGWSIADVVYQGEATSPPSAPAVTDDGAYTTAPDRLHASWSGDAGVVEYQYAIGASPTDLISDWTSAGTATDVTRTGLSLDAGTAYYWYVQARNPAGQWSPVGASDGVVVGTPTTVSAVRNGGSGEAVVLSSVIVTARFDDCAYVESADRSSGIRVNGTAQIPVDSTVDIAGRIHSAPEGNSIDPITWSVTGVGSVRALGMCCRDVAAYSSAATGLGASGLLVHTWGRVTSRGSGSFYLDDGSNVQNSSGSIGLRMICGSIDPPALYKLVLVTGIGGTFDSDGYRLPGLRLRDSADLQVLD